MATKIAKLKHLTNAQCVRFNDCGSITWHVFENEKDALRWKSKLVHRNAFLYGVDPMAFFNARGVALIYAEGPHARVKLRGSKRIASIWSVCYLLEDAETLVLRRIDEHRDCEDFCGGGEI